jgi:hypothetical protein
VDAVRLDQEKEILRVPGQGHRAALDHAHLGQLLGRDLQRLVRLVPVLQHDFEAVVARPGLEPLDLGHLGQKRGTDQLAFS